MTLTPDDLRTDLWRKLKTYMEQERANLRAKNDSLDTDERTTVINRAQIRVLTQLLALENRVEQQ